MTFAFSIANFIGSPILGALSDRFGRRPVLLLGFSALALSFFVTALATALWMLITVRLFSGAMQSNLVGRQRLRRRHHAARATARSASACSARCSASASSWAR